MPNLPGMQEFEEMKRDTYTRVQARGQITLPKDLRELTHIAPGDLVRIRVTDEGNIQIEPPNIKPLEYFWETFSVDGPIDVEAAIREAEEEEAQRFMERMSENE